MPLGSEVRALPLCYTTTIYIILVAVLTKRTSLSLFGAFKAEYIALAFDFLKIVQTEGGGDKPRILWLLFLFVAIASDPSATGSLSFVSSDVSRNKIRRS